MKKSVGPSWFLSVSSNSLVFQARENALFSSFSLVAFSLAAISIVPSKGSVEKTYFIFIFKM
jgi:hypothetical protein